MRTLGNPGLLSKIIGGAFLDRVRAGQGKSPATAEQKAKLAADRKLKTEGGDNPNRFQQAVRNSRRKGETFGQSARRLGGSGDVFGGD